MKNNFKQNLIQKIKEWQEITPFLFLWDKKELVLEQVELLAYFLCEHFFVDKNNIFYFSLGDEAHIKLDAIKNFLAPVYQKSNFAFQIFIIEDIEKMTRESANACLKIFEEPWVGNLIFLTSRSESGILDTILSRVSTVSLESEKSVLEPWEYFIFIKHFIEKGDTELLHYLYGKKSIEKEDAISFLLDIFLYLKESGHDFTKFSRLEEDLNGLKKNNLLPKYIIDKYLIKLSLIVSE